MPSNPERLLASLLVLPAIVCPANITIAEEYLSIEEAQALMFAKNAQFLSVALKLSEEQAEKIAEHAQVKVRVLEQRVWKVMLGSTLQGFFIVDDVIGKHDYITYALGLDAVGAVSGLEILTYREAQGGAVREKPWRDQFKGKDAEDKLSLGVSITNLSGATLSCKHITEGVRRLLSMYQLFLKPSYGVS